MGVSFCVSGRGLQIYFSEKGKLVGFICEWQEESVCLKWKPYFFIIKMQSMFVKLDIILIFALLSFYEI